MQESGEMYLETILVLSKKGKAPRATDVADQMGFSKPSVSRALGILREDGCLTVDPSGAITLTDKGHGLAEKIYERHRLLTEMLIRLGVSEKTAQEDACKIEHDISDESFAAIKEHLRTLFPSL